LAKTPSGEINDPIANSEYPARLISGSVGLHTARGLRPGRHRAAGLGGTYDIRTIPEVDKADMAKLEAGLKSAGYHLVGSPQTGSH
jgi:hypothetical protein